MPSSAAKVRASRVVGLCRFGIARIATRSDFAEQTQTPRLVTALLLALGQAQGLVCTPLSIVDNDLRARVLRRARRAASHARPPSSSSWSPTARPPREIPGPAPGVPRAPTRIRDVRGLPRGWSFHASTTTSRAHQGFDRGVVVTLCERQAADSRQGFGERER